MSSNDNVRDEDIIFQAAKGGNWRKVLKMYKEKKELRIVQIPSTGDTVLHMAVSRGESYTVGRIVDLVCQRESNEQAAEENGHEKNLVFGAKNKKGNTPLHLAASASDGSFEMCKKVGGADCSIITTDNNDGETPLFLAALHGNKEAFLWLHYHIPQGSSSDYKRNDKDTILHCAIVGGHTDLGIEIVHLYEQHLKDMTMTPDKNGLSLLHILAATPSTFESTDLPSRFFVVRLLYCFFRVNWKMQATGLAELKGYREQTIRETALRYIDKMEDDLEYALVDAVIQYLIDHLPARVLSCIEPIGDLIMFPLRALAWVLVVPLKTLKIFISTANWLRNWFHGIRKMKEKHVGSLQILRTLFWYYGSNDEAQSLLLTASQPRSTSPETIQCNEIGSKIVDPPLMIAAKNGVIEMVKEILELFPSGMNVLDDEGKNIVLLAAEKRQTRLYQFLYHFSHRDRDDNTAFVQVDKDGNTALHLAAKPGINLYGQTTTMIEEFKWFEFVKSSVPSELWESYNKEGKTAEEIFRDSYKEHMANDRKWLEQTYQTCSVASTLVASMAFSNFAGENIKKKNDSSLVALSLSLISTISILAIHLGFRSQSLNFWKYNAPFMLHFAILTMFSSIVALWISLMFHGHSRTTCAILGSPIAILTIVSLLIFIGPTMMSMFNPVPAPNRNITNAIHYRRPQKKENGVYKDQKSTPNPIQDTTGSPMTRSRGKRMKEALQVLISDMLEMEAQLKDA